MKFIRSSTIIMALIGAVTILFSTIMLINPAFVFFKNPIFITLVLVFIALQILCIITAKFSLKKIGFYICHIGVVLVLVSAIIDMFVLVDVSFELPVTGSQSYSTVNKSGGVLDFGFSISASDFQVEHYPQTFDVYKQDIKSQSGYSLYLENQSVDENGSLPIKGYQAVKQEMLKKDGNYLAQIKTEDGLIVITKASVDRKYSFVMHFNNGKNFTEKKVGVNQPADYKGWKFYLMDYDKQNKQYVSLYAKNDPVNMPIRIGIWFIIIGTFIMCFRLFIEKGGSHND